MGKKSISDYISLFQHKIDGTCKMARDVQMAWEAMGKDKSWLKTVWT